ncbi:MAG: zf-HC2 domain-containing protein [Polyangiaceae bacterium]|nr:zf-HC2 domain-containing protein [Polyangiaceae bacterium]
MRCHPARRSFWAYLDGEVDPRRRESLEAHLARCEACSVELAKTRAQWEALAEADQTPVLPTDLWPRVLAALDQAERLPWHRQCRTRMVQAACVSACVASGFAGGALLSWEQPATEAAPDTVSTGERMMVAEAFDTAAFGLSEGREGLLRCVPK